MQHTLSREIQPELPTPGLENKDLRPEGRPGSHDEKSDVPSTPDVLPLSVADGVTRSTYLGYATGEFKLHSLLSTINVITGCISSISMPLGAKLVDSFGRPEVYCVSMLLFIVGTIVEATSTGIKTYAGGAVIHAVGSSIRGMCLNIIIADTSSLKWRLLAIFANSGPVIITTWVSGNITSSVLSHTTWRWGVGMWAIVEPCAAVPLLALIFYIQYRARKAGKLPSYKSAFQRSWTGVITQMFWEFDVIGILALCAALVLFLYPLTVAQRASAHGSPWGQAHVLAPMLIGLAMFPVFVLWESRANSPMVPFKLLRDRGVWASFIFILVVGLVIRLQTNYLYAVLFVAFGESVESATRITQLNRFVGAVTGICLGFVVARVRRLKAFVLAGAALYMVGYGLLIRFRGSSETSGVIGAEVLLGIAGGLQNFPSLVSCEARTKHEHLAMVLALWTASTLVGGAIGAAIAGGIWTQVLQSELTKRLGDAKLAAKVYANPYKEILAYPLGTATRDAINGSYAHVQRILCTAGICLCVLLIVFGLLLRDTKLTDEHSRRNAEEESLDEERARRHWLWR